MPRFFAEVDFTQIPVANFVAEGSPTPPVASPRKGYLWLDTSLTNNAVMKYWDGDEWVRMDGGGDIPNEMILDRHIAANANIAWTKIDVPDDLVHNADLDAALEQVGDDIDTAVDAEAALRVAGDATLQQQIDNLGGSLTGSYVTTNTDQTVGGVKTFSASPIVPVADAPTEAVQFSQLTGLRTELVGLTDGLDGRLDIVEGLTQDINNATQTELNALTARVATAEGEIDTLQSDLDASEAAVAAEVARATAEEIDIRADFAAADTALGTQITDEAGARAQGDQTNATAITAERTRAEGAEAALDTRVDALEALDPTAEIDAAVTVERDRALAAESALDGRLDTLEGVDNLTQAEFNTFNTANTAALALKADLVDGKVPLSQLPSVRTDDVYVVDYVAGGFADVDEALASVTAADEGDVAVINGGPGGAFINTGSGWAPLSSGASGATDAEVTAAVAAEAALRAAADNALDARLDTLEAVDYATQAELDAVEDGLQAADTALGVRIDTEHSHHAADRAAVESALATEVAARTAADADLQDAIDAEAQARDEADDALSGRITQEVSDRGAADTQIRTDFAAADATNAAAITAEVGRATSAEGVLTSNLAAEVSRATDAEGALQTAIGEVETDLAAEITRATGVEGGHNTRLLALEAAGTTAGQDLTALTARVTAAEDVNTTQNGRLDAVEAHNGGEAARIAAAVATETTARTAADTALGSRIDDEATARGAADTALGGRIDSEITNRTSADTALGARIDSVESAAAAAVADEATARANADTAIRTDFGTVDTAIRSEFAAADTAVRGEFAAADAALLTNINTRALDANVVHKTGNETVAGTKTFTSPVGVPAGVDAGDAVNLAQLQAAQEDATYDDSALTDRLDDLEAHDTAETTRVDDALALKADLVGGKVPSSQLPALALTNVQVVADDAARDALTGLDEGDVVVVTNSGSAPGNGRASFIFDGTNLVPLSSPADVTEAELAAAVSNGLDALRTELTGLIDDTNDAVDALTFGNGGVRNGDAFDVVGTTARIVANANSIDIASDYVGQASITTVGTITTGTWHGNLVGVEYGGTGYAATDAADLVDYLFTEAEVVVPAIDLFAQTLTGLTAGVEFSVNHAMNASDVIPSLRTVAGGEIVFADIRVIDANHVGVTVDPSYDVADALRITIVGGAVDGGGKIMGRSPGRRD